MDIFSEFYLAISTTPGAALFILLLSVFVNLLSIWLTDRFVDMEKMKSNREFIAEWQAKAKEARKTMDPLLLQEVQDMQPRVMRMNADMMGARCKPTLIFFIPFLIMWNVLAIMYAGAPIAVVPFNVDNVLFFFRNWIGIPVPGGFGMFYWSWYMLTSIGLGGILRKIVGQDIV